MGRGHIDVDGVDMLDDHLSGHELLDRLVAAAIPGGRNQSVGHGRHFIPDVTGGGRVFDPHAISQFQQAVHLVFGPEEHLDPELRRPLLDETILRGAGEEEHRDDEDPEAQYAVHRIPDDDGGVPGLGERAGNVLRPVGGLEVRTPLPTDYRPPLTSRLNQPTPSSQTQKSNSGASGTSVSS